MATKIIQMKELVSKNPDVYDDLIPCGTFSNIPISVNTNPFKLDFDTTYYIYITSNLVEGGGEGGLMCYSGLLTTPPKPTSVGGRNWYFPIGNFDGSIQAASTMTNEFVTHNLYLKSTNLVTSSSVNIEVAAYIKSTRISIHFEGTAEIAFYNTILKLDEVTTIQYKKIQ